MPRFGRYGPCLKAPHPRRSSRGLQRKMRQAGSIPADDRGLKNAGENAMPSGRAERLLQWKQDGVKAAAEYESKERATRLLTVKLRTERLAREVTSGNRCLRKAANA